MRRRVDAIGNCCIHLTDDQSAAIKDQTASMGGQGFDCDSSVSLCVCSCVCVYVCVRVCDWWGGKGCECVRVCECRLTHKTQTRSHVHSSPIIAGRSCWTSGLPRGCALRIFGRQISEPALTNTPLGFQVAGALHRCGQRRSGPWTLIRSAGGDGGRAKAV